MLTLEIIFVLLAGLALGSFLNVCISRLPRHQSIVLPASHCPRCNAPLAAYDNIPLISFALLRGHCRHCRKKISWRYPLVEVAAAALTLACILTFGLRLNGIAITIFCLILLTLAVCDAETFRLPDVLTLPLAGLGILVRAAVGYTGELHYGSAHAWHSAFALGLRAAISAVTAAFAFVLLRYSYWLLRRHHGLGLGDAKLAAGIAGWLGIRQMGVVIFLAVVAGALVAALAVRDRRATDEDHVAVPFGAFLCAAAIYSVFFGQLTLRWYLRFFP